MKQELIIKDAELYRALKTLQVSGKLNRFGVYDVCIEDMTEIENAFYFYASSHAFDDLTYNIANRLGEIKYINFDDNTRTGAYEFEIWDIKKQLEKLASLVEKYELDCIILEN